MKSLNLIAYLILMVGHIPTVIAVTDAELEALEKQLEQQEMEAKRKAEAEAKRKAEEEEKRLAEQQAEEKKKQEAEEKRLDELEKQLIEKERRLAEQQAEEKKKQEAEEKRLADEEAKKKSLTVPRLIKAQDYSRQENIEVGGEWGPDFIHNRAPYIFHRENLVEYDVTFNQSGKYEFSIEYAAAQSRPVDVYLNGDLIKKGAIATITGGWNPQHCKWQSVAIVLVKQGKNVLRIYRSSVFPHIRNIKFEPIK